MSRVILFSYTKVFVGGITFGPTIRTFEIAKALKKKGHKVVIAEPDRKREEIIDGIRFIPRTTKLLKSIKKDFDVAYCQIWDSEPVFLDAVSKIPLMIDVYAPLLIEQSVFFSMNFRKITKHLMDAFIRDRFIPDTRILKYSDLLLVASERQKYYYTGLLNALGIINPKTYKQGIIEIVPYGVPSKKPEYKGPVFKGKIVDKDKKIIIWPSGIMPWYDAETAIKAMKIVSKKRKDVVMVFVGSLSKRSNRALTYKGYKRAEKLAEKLKLLNKNVFFTEWLPYDKRSSMYFEAEFAVSTYKHGYETELSFRTRIADCLWGRLPVICTKGDFLSEEIEKHRLGFSVDEGDYKELAKKILFLLENPQEIKAMKKRIDSYVENKLVWDKVVEPINKFCKKPKKIKKELMLDIYKILDDKEKIVKEQSKLIKELREKIDFLKGRVKSLEAEKKKIEARVKEVDKKLRVELNSKSRMVEDLGKQMRLMEIERREERQELKHELKKHIEIIEQKDKELQQVYERLRLHDIERTKERLRLEEEKNNLNKTIKEKEEQINNLNKTIKEKNKLINELELKTQELSNKTRLIEEISSQVEALKRELLEKDSWIQRITSETTRLIEEKNKEIWRLKSILNEIVSSRGYKLASKIDRIARTLGIVRKRKINKNK